MINQIYQHGGTVQAKYDYSINLNPLGIPLLITEGLHKLSDDVTLISSYPDSESRKLCSLISDYHNCSDKNIIVSNGASGIIFSSVIALKPKKALLLAPTFSEYERSLKTVGTVFKYHLLEEERDFALTSSIFTDLGKLNAGDVFFLCNPNNPVGNIIDFNLIEEIINFTEMKGIFLILDECFIDFTNSESSFEFIRNKKNVIWVNTFTKLYSIPSFRIGYGYCSNKKIIQKIQENSCMWGVSGYSQKIVESIFEEKEFIKSWKRKTLNLVKEERQKLMFAFQKKGFKTYNSEANFFLVKQTENIDEILKDKTLDEFFLSNDISIRKCFNYRNLSTKYFRFAVKDKESNQYLISVLEKL